jgi:hypothetical protein
MARRCPDAKPFSLFHMENWKLVFRGVADIVPSPGDYVPGGLWIISDNDELALDRYEGFRADGSGMYRKETIAIEPYKIKGETFTEIMFYVMNSDGIFPPSQYYLASIKEGYKNFGLKTKPLIAAVEASYDDKNPSHVERRRHQRNGRPTLAARPSELKKNKQSPIKVIDSKPADAKPHNDHKPNAEHAALWRKAMTVYGD